MTDSQTLLAEYVQSGSDVAFRELVSRYVNLVYSTALRLVSGNTHQAEDVTQTVFFDLAKKARELPSDLKVAGWLHRDTCFVASKFMRSERRRQIREKEAVEMNALNAEAAFSQIAPVLDEAINELGEEDRTAILLRFFEQHDFRTLGQMLGNSEDAARMRVNRALEKLEIMLKRRGVTAGSVTLGVLLGANAIQAAPVGLALTISTAAISGSTLTAATATKAIVIMTTLQKTLVTATVSVLAGVGIYEARQASNARAEADTLRQKQVPMVEQIEQLHRQREDASNQIALLTDELGRMKANRSEILRLRGEIGMLRRNGANSQNAHLLRNQKGKSDLFAEEMKIGAELGRAVVEGDPLAMTKLTALAQVKENSFNTNQVGLTQQEKADLEVETFAPIETAFDIIAEAASKGNTRALEALRHASQQPQLTPHAAESLGHLAATGNDVALDILIDPKKYSPQFFAYTVVALRPMAISGNQKVIDFLARVLTEEDQRPYWALVASVLESPAQSNNSVAIEALRNMSNRAAK